jgi:hypothetical protein
MNARSSKSVAIPFDDVLNAYEFVSAATQSENEAYISASTGQIYYVSSIAREDELPEDAEESDDYISVPHKNDLDLGRNLVFSFAQQELPDACDDIQDMFRRRAPMAGSRVCYIGAACWRPGTPLKSAPPKRRCARGARRSAFN